jgi:hypothetical protein
MPDTKELLAQQYRQLLIDREETARLSILKDYRGLWRGLGDQLDAAMGNLRADPLTSVEVNESFADEIAAAAKDEGQVQVSPDKMARVADLLLQKDAWKNVETRLDLDFESVADKASDLTKAHGAELGKTAIEQALQLMGAELDEKNKQVRQQDDQRALLSPEKIKEIKDTVADYVDRSWRANQLAVKDAFRLKASDVATKAREALRREVMQGLLLGADTAAKDILARVDLTMDARDKDPASDPALVRALRSEYRINVVDGYRDSLRLTYEQSGKVKQWRWTSARTAGSCAICWENDGKIFSVGTTLRSHPHCRCVMVPVTEGETSPVQNKPTGQKQKDTGAQAFAKLSAADQKAVLGPQAFEAYQNGEFELVDLIGLQYNQRFGVMMYRQSLDQARENALNRNEAQKKDANKFIDPATLIEGRVPVRKKLPKYNQRDIDSGVILQDDGATQLQVGEMTPLEFWQMKKGFGGKGNIRIPVSAKFLKASYPDGITPEFLFWHALQTLRDQFYFNQEAIDRYGAEVAGKLRYIYRPDKDVTTESLKNDAKTGDYLYVWFSAEALQKLYRYGLEATGDTERLDTLDRDIAIRQKNEEMEKTRPKNNPVAEMFWEWHREMEMKDFIRDYTAKNITRDTRDPNNSDANSLADTIEKFFRDSIELHPLYRLLPDSVKSEIVKFGMGGVNGAINLSSSVAGAAAFLQDASLDLLVWGADRFGVSKYMPGFDQMVKQNQQFREDRKAFFTKYSSLTTKEMQNQVDAYQTIVANGLPTVPWDTPNWSAAGGNFVVQALPFIALSLATGGVGGVGGVILEGTVNAGAQGLMALGNRYISSNKYRDSLISGGLATVQGAVGGLTNKLPFAANLAADALSTYVFGKISGQSDDEIFQQIVLQTGFAAGMKGKEGVSELSKRSFEPGGSMNTELLKLVNSELPGGKLPVTELSTEQAQKEFMKTLEQTSGKSSAELAERLRSVLQKDEMVRQIERETAGAKDGKNPNAAKPVRSTEPGKVASKLLAEYGKNNRVVSAELASNTRKALAKQLTGATPFSSGEFALPMAKLAAFHVEAGVRTFVDFVRLVGAEWKGAKLTTDEYAKLYESAVKEVNSTREQEAGRNGETPEKITPDDEGIKKFKDAEKAAADEAAKIKADAERAAAEKAKQKTKNKKKPAETKPETKPVKAADAATETPTEKTPDKKTAKQEKVKPTAEEQAAEDAKNYKNYDDVKELLNKDFDAEALKKQGYVIRYVDGEPIISRKTGQVEGNAKLIVDLDGKVVIDHGGGSKRISDPTKMKNNFRDQLIEDLYGKGTKPTAAQKAFISEVMDNFQRHHLVSDNLVRNTDLGKLARRASYDLDQTDNLIGLVNDKALIGKPEATKGANSEILDFNTGHWDYHPKYDKMVRDMMNERFEQLKSKFGADVEKILNDPRSPVPVELQKEIFRQMREIEIELRQKIKNGEVPKTPDGRLAELEGADDGDSSA